MSGNGQRIGTAMSIIGPVLKLQRNVRRKIQRARLSVAGVSSGAVLGSIKSPDAARRFGFTSTRT